MPIAPDIRAEAERLSSEIADAGLGMRLMGGLAVWLVAPSVREPPFAREYGDLDFAVRKRDGRAVSPFLAEQGYVPERLFNSIHGAQRLNFGHPDGRWTIDVIVDELRMSHLIDLRGRLEPGRPTIDLADLLLTKLQVWEINAKDLGDITCLLADRPLSEDASNPEAIDLSRILALTGADWGLCHTLERNLRTVAGLRATNAGRSTPRWIRSSRRRRCSPPSPRGASPWPGASAGGSASECAGMRRRRRSSTSCRRGLPRARAHRSSSRPIARGRQGPHRRPARTAG